MMTNKVPKHLSHQPIIGVDNYSMYDGIHKDNTDAMALSVGVAQWEEKKGVSQKEISAKVFRYDDIHKKWSRQSEELPIHRCFDLSCLIIQAIQRCTKGQFFPTTKEEPLAYVVNEKELEDISLFYETNKEIFLSKMNQLKYLLDSFLQINDNRQ